MRPARLVPFFVMSMLACNGLVGLESSEDDAPPLAIDASADGAADDGSSDASDATFTLVVTAENVIGTGLVLRDRVSRRTLAIAPLGRDVSRATTFATDLRKGQIYDLEVQTHPSQPSQRCELVNALGVVSRDVSDVVVRCPGDDHAVGGRVDALLGSGLVLDNAGDLLPVSADGPFTFGKRLREGSLYAVTVNRQPVSPWQTCSVGSMFVGTPIDGGVTGTVAGSDITDLRVSCERRRFDLVVRVSGLSGSGLVVENALQRLPIASNGTYTMMLVESGLGYDLTVHAQPANPWQECQVVNGSGIVQGTTVTVDVACAVRRFYVRGTVQGLVGTGLVLKNSGGDAITLDGPQNGPFSFAIPVTSGSPYRVALAKQPSGAPDEVCRVVPDTAAGTIMGSDVTNVAVECRPAKRTFLTSARYDANLGGLAGADTKCQALASAAGLPGTYKAWLSDSTTSASARLTHATVRYALVDGTPVAADWPSLVSGALLHPIDLTERGEPLERDGARGCSPFEVRTGTAPDGTRLGGTCADWTDANAFELDSTAGVSDAKNAEWTNACPGGPCGALFPLYCMQQ